MTTREQYRTSECDFYWGNGNVVLDVTADVDSCTRQGNATVPRYSRQTGPGRLGKTADGVAAGFTANISCRLSDVTEGFYTHRTGILVIDRKDVGRAEAIPMVVQTINDSIDRDGATMLTVQLTQRNLGLPVEGVRVTSGNLVPDTGEEGYIVGSSSITRVTSSTAVTTGGVGVKGAPLVAERVTP